MGKNKRARPASTGGTKTKTPYSKQQPHSHKPDKNSNQKPQQQKKSKQHSVNSAQGAYNPFENPESTVLLVGDGDFSFSRSLLDHHGCFKMICTSYDDAETLKGKYPQAEETVNYLVENEQVVLHGVDAVKLGKVKKLKGKKFERIVFMFPHVGGVTKDVNRQVRLNQELLLGFFQSASGLLDAGGKICVTLFEGAPYDEWGIRGLAKTAGLRSHRSCRFNWSEYPAYHHARTLGNLEGGGWKGEERDARLYVFEKNEGDATPGKKRKRKSGEESSSDEE